MTYQFLIDTCEAERLKSLSVWSMFRDEDMSFRPHPRDLRGRNVHEQMVHRCVSEDLWFRTILEADVGAPPLPANETRYGFIERYALGSGRGLEQLRKQADSWWEEVVHFFDTPRARTGVIVRRSSHPSHHRGQQPGGHLFPPYGGLDGLRTFSLFT